LTAIVAGSVYWLVKSYGKKNKEMSYFLVVISLLVSYIGLFVHGDPPGHYYYVIYPIPAILAGYLIAKTFKNRYARILLALLLGFTGVLYLINTNWFYQDKVLAEYISTTPPYLVLNSVADEIYKDSKGVEFSLGRIGFNNQFENNFAGNYIYLLTIRWAKLNSNAKLKYTIVEERNTGEIAPGKEIWSGDGIQIFKSVK
jgi:hypothetical protein